MSQSTGPILAAAAMVVGNAVIVHDKTWASQARVAVGAVVVAGGLNLMERLLPSAAVAFAWLILAGVALARVEPTTPSPAESFADWWGRTP